MAVQSTVINIPAPNKQQMEVTIVGTSPIIFHRWTEKAKLMLLKTQMKDPEAKKKGIREPEAEYLDSFYRDSEGRISWPVLNIKKAMTDAARNIEGVTMTLLRGAIFTQGDKDGMVPILVNGQPAVTSGNPTMYDLDKRSANVIGEDPQNPNIQMREDMVRVGIGSADLRYRGQLQNWSIKFILQYNADMLSAGQVLNLLNTAGFACGLGEWRPQCNGSSGTFEVQQGGE